MDYPGLDRQALAENAMRRHEEEANYPVSEGPMMTMFRKLEKLDGMLCGIMQTLMSIFPPIEEGQDKTQQTPSGCKAMLESCLERADGIGKLAMLLKSEIGVL